MKKALRIYGIMVVALLVTFTMAFSTVTMANDNKPADQIEFKFIGKLEDQPLFQLNLANTEEDEYTITFRDASGSVLYSNTVKGTNITRKFTVNADELGDDTWSVEVKAKKSNKSQLYTISSNRAFVEETVVSKL
jgi:hypothetical protein